MICKYFLQFCRLPFHFVDGFLCCAEAFQFEVVTLVYFCFCCLCFWCQIQKIIAKTNIKELTLSVFFQEFYGFMSLIHFVLIFVYGVRWWSSFILFFFFLINLFLAVLGLHCCVWALSSCSEQGPLLAAVHRPLIAVASPAVEHGLQACGSQQSCHVGSAVVAHGPSCSTACGIFPDQRSNLCPLNWQVDSQTLCHQGSPSFIILHVAIQFSQHHLLKRLP